MKVKAIILAGGFGKRLNPLTLKRAKPAVPFAGKYRIIDFALSNCVNSNIFDVVVLTQYRPHSLNDHIGSGRPWDLDRTFTGGVAMLQPFKGRFDTDWYAGTADAVFQNLNFLRHDQPDAYLILTGDHVYCMNYHHFIKAHKESGADMTVGVHVVPPEEASRFGIVTVNSQGRITRFSEKPSVPETNLASMGIYVFKAEVLERALYRDQDACESSRDFGADVLPQMVASGCHVQAFHHEGYWVDVGTTDAYWKAHMDLLHSPPALDLADRNWVIRTRGAGHPSARIGRDTNIAESIISDGVVIHDGATVLQSVLSPGVTVSHGSVVYQSVILNDTFLDEGASLQRCIVDKRCRIGKRAHLGGLEPEPLTLIGKSVHLPDYTHVDPGCILGSDITEDEVANCSGHVTRTHELGFSKRGYYEE